MTDQAVQRPNREAETRPFADPRTGEVISLDDADDETIAETVAAIDTTLATLRDMRALGSTELRNRIARRVLQPGPWEVTVESGRTREWDPEALEAVMRELLDAGTFQPSEVTELFRREVKVNGGLAARLLGRLEGAAERAMTACFSWKHGNPRVRVTPKAIEATATEVEDFPA
jgi:hypothetical protein